VKKLKISLCALIFTGFAVQITPQINANSWYSRWSSYVPQKRYLVVPLVAAALGWYHRAAIQQYFQSKLNATQAQKEVLNKDDFSELISKDTQQQPLNLEQLFKKVFSDYTKNNIKNIKADQYVSLFELNALGKRITRDQYKTILKELIVSLKDLKFEKQKSILTNFLDKTAGNYLPKTTPPILKQSINKAQSYRDLEIVAIILVRPLWGA